LNLPSGIVTFLFTDIEGSTKLWEEHPEAMRAALARHDALLRQAIESNSGVVFKTVGDAFCAAFASAPDALHAALAAQRALHAEPWPDRLSLRVRMALHTGMTEERDGDYFGQPLNIATTLNNLAVLTYEQGDFTTARALHEESLALRRELGDKQSIG